MGRRAIRDKYIDYLHGPRGCYNRRMKKGDGYHHGDLRAALVREGRKLLDREGFEGFSLRKLSGIIGVSPMASYRHFATRDDLLAAIVDDAYERFADALEASVGSELPPAEQATRLCVAYVRFFTKNPDILKVLFLQTRERDDTMLRRRSGEDALKVGYGTQRSYRIFVDIAARAAPGYPDLKPEEAALAIWSRAHGLAILLSQESWHYDVKRLTDESLERILRSAL